MKLFGIVAATAVLACSAPALAAPEKADNSEANDPNRQICKTEKVTGSRLGKVRRCLTAAQWAEVKSADRQAIERVQNQRYKNE